MNYKVKSKEEVHGFLKITLFDPLQQAHILVFMNTDFTKQTKKNLFFCKLLF